MKKIIILLVLMLGLTACMSLDNEKEETETSFYSSSDYEISSLDKIPVTRAEVAKMIALCFNDKVTIQKTDIEISFTDLEMEWYIPYINIVVLQGYMVGAGEKFLPNKLLTLKQAQILLDNINPNNNTKIKMTADIEDKPISYALWSELFLDAVKSIEPDFARVYSIKEEELIVLTTPNNNSEQPEWTMNTNRGTYGFSGLNMDAYIDCKVKVYSKENEIISIIGVTDEAPIIENAFIAEVTENSMDIFISGAKRTYTTENNMILDSTMFETNIADIQISKGKILKVRASNEVKQENLILRAGSDYIEFIDGKIETDENIRVYSNVNGNVASKSIRNLIVGTDIAQYIMKNGKVCAAIITKEYVPEKIRVVIGTTGFSSLVHDSLKVTAYSEFCVERQDKIIKFSKGEILDINKENEATYFGNSDRLFIYLSDANSEDKIEVSSILRNGKKPLYRGILEIAKQGEGYSIVNEVDLEQYLYAVVPSEMPTSYGKEASKVQAITARSYAYNQIFSNRYYEYGANADDSTNSQVYNNTPENSTSIVAVNETKGQVLTYKSSVISANFFSTSSGVTANSGEVWMNTSTKEFPANTQVYLTSQKHYQNADFGDLSKEENASKFYKNLNVESYDSDYSWFRWNVTMNVSQLSDSINASIKTRYLANKWAIKTLVSEGIYRSRDIETIGELKDIQVLKRGEGGNIMELLLVGTEATVKVLTEYNIRVLLKPAKIGGQNNIVLKTNSGNTINNYSLMPSAFFTFDKQMDEKGKLVSVTFYGGGNGHGVGMSQNGVKTMSDLGYSCEDILKHYYKGTEIGMIGE